MKKITVLYHANCPDGFGAAWSAWKKFGENADYIGVEHHVPPPEGLQGKDIYILDFSYDKDTLGALVGRNKRVVILDHHISARSNVESVPEHIFDNDHSGAVIAWHYFHSKKKLPKMLKHIEDVDLWSFKLPKTKEISAALTLVAMDFKAWDRFARDIELPSRRNMRIAQGKAAIEYRTLLIAQIIKGAREVAFEGYHAYAINSPVFRSELGNALLTESHPIAIIWYEKKGIIKASLRSRKEADVSKIAARHGGGGHEQAASFRFPVTQEFPWKELSK